MLNNYLTSTAITDWGAAGENHSLAIDEDGSLWVWGDNGYGQLGDGTSGNANNKNIPVNVLPFVE